MPTHHRALPRRLLATLFLLLSGFALGGSFDDPSSMSRQFPKKPAAVRESEVLVRFKGSVPQATRDSKHARQGNVKLRELGRSRVHHVRIARSRTLAQELARYRADPDVEYAEPNYVLRAMRLPDEPAFNLLWAMQNTGQTLGTPGADIKAPSAWDLTVGSPGVVVMVIDSGVDYNHPDLAANIWVNPAEVAGNGFDDDGNGYVDDVHGIDVVNGDADPMDDYGHGTHVAGTIGAVGNNTQGVVGVAWNVKIIPCKILDAAGSGSVADAVACLDYARALKARGVNIVATNNSYGGLGAYSQTMVDAIKAQPDILFIAAAGNSANDNDTQPFYPAAFDLPNVIAVAATDHNDAMPSFSNFGRRTVHLAAPGANITSTTPLNSYQAANGTSMSAPHVAGLAALLKAQDPTRDWRAIRNLILAGGDVRASTAGKTVSGRRLNAFGSASCSTSPLFSLLKVPAAFTVGVTATVSALSIDCANAVGPVTATTSAGETFTLLDDGVAPDAAAGDGIFTASWTPSQAFTTITFSSAAGSEQLGVTDLAVTAVGGPASASPGSTVALNVTLSNPSTVTAPASTLNLYLSVDGVITAADTLLGSVATPELAAGTQQVIAASVAIPTALTPGTYFLGAIVDPSNAIAEGNEANNARAGNTIAVSSLAVDLTVSAVSAPATAFTGDLIPVTATVTNLGTGTAGASTLNFYLSSDSVITSADSWIGTAGIAALGGGQSQTAAGSLPIPANLPPGTYYIGAIADGGNAVAETNEANNARAGNTITTTTRPIDLTVTAVSGPATAKDAQAVTLNATVKNLGSAAAPASTLRWYLSTDGVITTSDTPVADALVPTLGPGSSVPISVTVSLPTSVATGSYVIGAIVDPDNTLAETNDANNALAGGTVAVSYSVDLVMSSVSGPPSAATGQMVTYSGTVTNQGLAPTAGNVIVGFYLSTDSKITTADTLIGTTTIPPIAAGTTVPVSVAGALRTSLAAGSYWIGAIVDPGNLTPESNKANNATAGYVISVGYGPDLVMTAVSGPATAARGSTITLTGTLRNQGVGTLGALSFSELDAAAAAVKVAFYLSTDAVITKADTKLGSVTIPSLASGSSLPISVSVSLPKNLAPGTYTLGAIADDTEALNESNELNNALAGSTIVVY